MRSLTDKFYLLAVLTAVSALFSCEQITAGLGSKVDILAPVVRISEARGPVPGSLISGVQRVYINATDDNGIKSVTLTYTYRVLRPDGKLEEQAPVTVPALMDSDSGEYFVDIDTLSVNMADGVMTVEVAAMDSSGKLARSDKLIYTVKNAPPALEVQVPRPRNKDGMLDNEASAGNPLPMVITGNYIMGIYQDLAGVARGYPQIQFWRDDTGQTPPPLTDTANAGWNGVILDDGANDGWIAVDQGLAESDAGDKGNTFKYYLRNHNPNGSPMAEQSGEQLPDGKYSLRIKIRDILGKEQIWPRDSYENKPDRIRMELLATGTPPLIKVLRPGNMYQRTGFTIEAMAEPRGDMDKGIGGMSLGVSGKDREGKSAAVTLATWKFSGVDSGSTVAYSIEVGKTYYNKVPDGEVFVVDDETGVPGDACSFITFGDGAYNFTLRALSLPTGAIGQETLVLYIDRTPPVVSVTGVKPAFSEDSVAPAGTKGTPGAAAHADSSPYRRWTVNSTVKIGVSSTDNRGNALEENGRMKFKYLLFKDSDILENDYANWQRDPAQAGKSFGDHLFERSDAVYFDEVKDKPVSLKPAVPGNTNPLMAVSGGDGAYTLTLQTQHYDHRDKYPLWFYIVSRDNAGNTSYARALLNVDQATDNPVVKFGNLNPNNSPQGLSFIDETTNIKVEITDDDGLHAQSVEYRFAEKYDGSHTTWSHPDDDTVPWFSLDGTLSADNFSILIQNLSLKKISCDLKGHPYDSGHPIHTDVLGSEMDTKVIQIRVRDDGQKKVLDTDGVKTGKTEETRFTMDLTWPEIIPSSLDNRVPGKPISRDLDNPFGDPQKDGAYRDAFAAYGDLSEKNLLSFTVIIDGEHKLSFPVPNPIPDSEPPLKQPTDNSRYVLGGTGKSERPVPAVWKTKKPWNGELRWRFPLDYEVPAVFNEGGDQIVSPAYVLWEKLGEGGHTFMLQAEDKVPRTVSKQITFYKDSKGPLINLITLSEKIRLSDKDLEDIRQNNISSALQARLDKIKAMAIKDTDAKITGAFTDDYSAVHSHFWYKIDKGPWTKKNLTVSGKTATWELALPASGSEKIGDGLHRLSIRVADSLGNGYGFRDDAYTDTNPREGPGAETNIGFILDRKEPNLIILSPYGDKDTDETVYAYKTAGEAAGTNVITVKGLAGDSSLKTVDPVLAVIDGVTALPGYITTQQLNWRGSYPDALAVTAPVRWDAYHHTTGKKYYVYNGSSWEELGPADNQNPYDADEGEKTLLWTFTLNAAQLDSAVNKDGLHKAAFSVKDSTGREVTKVWNFIRDNTPPEISIISGDPGLYSEDNPVIIQSDPKIQGIVSDLHGKVVKLEALLEKKNNGKWETVPAVPPVPPVPGRDWEELAVSQGRWFKDLAGKDDGQYRITIRALDDARTGAALAGNLKTLGALNFIIDTTSPVIPDLPIVPFRNGSFTLSGEVMDKNRVTISAALDGVKIAGIAPPTQKDAETYQWSFTVPVSPSTTEGSHTVTVTAADKAGWITAKAYNFTYDKTPPEVSITAPGTGSREASGSLPRGGWVFYDSRVWINGLVDVRGTSTDTNGIAKISYYLGKLDGSADGAVSTGGDGEAQYNSIAETNNPATGWTDTGLHTGSPASGWNGGVYSWTLTENFNAYAGVTGKIINNTGTNNTATDYYLPLYMKVEDVAGNIQVLHYNLWVDPDLDKPQVSISNPGNNATVGGEVRISGTASDDDWVYGVQVRIKTKYNHDNDSTTPDREAYYKNDGDSFIYGDLPLDHPDAGWIWAKIAGNTNKVVPWYYIINSDGKLNPPPGSLREVTIEARAQDTKDDFHQSLGETGIPQSIKIKFDSNVPTISHVRIKRSDSGSPVDLTAGIRAGGAFIITADVKDEGGITSIKARETGDTTFREMLINPKSSWTVTPKGGASREYEIRVEVNSTDLNLFPYGKSGNYSLELRVTDNNASPAPYVTEAAYNVLVDNYFPRAQFTTQYNASTKNFYISGTAEDYDKDSGPVQGLERVLVYFERNGGYMNAAGVANSGMISYAQGNTGNVQPSGSPGGIKNFPVLTLDGRVWKSDHAMVIDNQEIDRDNDTDKDGTYAEIWQDDGAVKKWQARFDTTRLADGPLTVHYAIMDQAGNASHYTQGIYIRNNPPIIRQFTLGTDLDGKHASLETQAPVIVAALNGGTVEFRQIAAIDTQFTARNYLLNFNLLTFGGNGNKHYKVSRVEAGAATASTGLTPGEVYTIKDPGNTNWKLLGAPEPINGDHTGTTFVATGPAAATDARGNPTTGTVIPYVEVTGTVKLVSPVPGDTGDVRYEQPADFANIPDSIAAGLTTGDKKLFIVKVYDSTAPGSGENDQLAHAILLKLDVDNVDETPPDAGIKPFYWNSGTDNSLYEHKAANGHIELETELPAAFTAGGTHLMDRDPKVSGRISLRGTAYDNAMLKTLWIHLAGFDFGAPTVNINGRDYVLAAEYLGQEDWNEVDNWGTKGWKFTVDKGNQVHDQSGHRVSWRLDIDTANISGSAAVDREFRFLARDGNSNDSAENNTQTAAQAETPYYRVDVVPYVTEVETRLSVFNRNAPSVYARTARGIYPVADNDDLTVYGFNLGGNPVISAQGAANFTINGMGRISDPKDPRAPWEYAKINIGAAAKSGDLSVTVNNLPALNNTNNNSAPYNRQENSVNNDTLTDDTALDVWQFTEAFKSRSASRYPTMKVGPQGQIGFSFANDYQWFNMPGYKYGDSADPANFWSQTPYQRGFGGYSHNTFAFDAKGNTYGAVLNVDEAGVNQSANFTFMNRRPDALPNNMVPDDNYTGSLLNSMRLENTTMPSNPYMAGNYIVDINRIQSPAMVTSMPNPGTAINNTDNRVSVYLAYYDHITGQVRFRAGTVGADRSSTQGSDFHATLASNNRISAAGHGLENGTEVYLRSDKAIGADRTRPYYVIESASNYFALTSVKGNAGKKITLNGSGAVVVSVSGGGLADLSGQVKERISPIDGRPSNYQMVAASGAYNAGKDIAYKSADAAYTTRYPYATTYGPGGHVAIGVVKNGKSDVVVLAWYDEVNSQLVYSWNDNPSGASADQWQDHAKSVETYAGEGVSLAVDSNGGIHLAYYSANGADLKYAYAPSYNGAFKTIKVDAYLSVGTHSTITVGKDGAGRVVPYISYYATGAAALRAKLAYRAYHDAADTNLLAAGADEQDKFTGAWEVTTVPTPRTPTEYRISVGAWTDDAGNIKALPTNPAGAASTVFEGLAYGGIAVNPPTRLYGNGTKNPVVGYGTTMNLEMAQKK
jgi:hypothetical protein